MRVTVLGKSPAWQDAGGACTGYLVEHGDATLLLDCGSGVFAKLRAIRDHHAVEAIVLTHLHADHLLDLVPFAYALTYGPRRPAPRPVLHVPPGGDAMLHALPATWGAPDLIADAFAIVEYDPAQPIAVGQLSVDFREVDHYVTAHAVAISAPGSGRFVFSADTGPSDALVDFAAGADLLLIEASIPDAAADDPDDRGHLSPAEAGAHAARAHVARLVLTHISDELDLDAALAAARAAFTPGAPVEIAAEGATYEL